LFGMWQFHFIMLKIFAISIILYLECLCFDVFLWNHVVSCPVAKI
jgi:hypothetical protein